MNALINAAVNPFVGILRRSGLITDDLDYHFIRASMVIIFFLRLPEVVGLRDGTSRTLHQQWPADLVALSHLWPPGGLS